MVFCSIVFGICIKKTVFFLFLCLFIRTFAVEMLYLTSYFPITSPTLIFFVVLLIILLAPIIMGKLRIPHIIGMVLAGVLVGKYGLNILERDSSFELFGKVGLLYIMFLAGLEMDLESVKKNSRRFLLFGLLTCLIPLLITYFMAIFARMYHGIEHADSIPYHITIRSRTRFERNAQRRVVNDLAVSGPADAGSTGSIVW